MSLQRVNVLSKGLPHALRAQVIGYAESVERILPDIFAEIGRPVDQKRIDTVVFWAGVRKLYSLVAAAFWTLDNSIEMLSRSEINCVQIGGSRFSRTSPIYARIRELLYALEAVASEESFRLKMEESPKESLLRTYAE